MNPLSVSWRTCATTSSHPLPKPYTTVQGHLSAIFINLPSTVEVKLTLGVFFRPSIPVSIPLPSTHTHSLSFLSPFSFYSFRHFSFPTLFSSFFSCLSSLLYTFLSCLPPSSLPLLSIIPYFPSSLLHPRLPSFLIPSYLTRLHSLHQLTCNPPAIQKCDSLCSKVT